MSVVIRFNDEPSVVQSRSLPWATTRVYVPFTIAESESVAAFARVLTDDPHASVELLYEWTAVPNEASTTVPMSPMNPTAPIDDAAAVCTVLRWRTWCPRCRREVVAHHTRPGCVRS